MRKVTLLFTLMAVLSCSCSARPFLKNRSSSVEPADSVIAVLSDSVSNVIFNSTNVEIYPVVQEDSLSSEIEIEFKNTRSILVEGPDSVFFRKDTLVYDSICFSMPEKLNSAHRAILQFLLSDDRMYMKGDNYPSAPFIPEYMIQFIDKKHSVQILVSLSGGFFKIYCDRAHVKTLKYTHEHLMLYFLSVVTEDESLKELLNLQIFN